jgi:hypothetical protein
MDAVGALKAPSRISSVTPCGETVPVPELRSSTVDPTSSIAASPKNSTTIWFYTESAQRPLKNLQILSKLSASLPPRGTFGTPAGTPCSRPLRSQDSRTEPPAERIATGGQDRCPKWRLDRERSFAGRLPNHKVRWNLCQPIAEPVRCTRVRSNKGTISA